MRKLFLLLILFSVYISAQNQRFLYEYKFITDSTKKVDVKSELLVLDLNDKGSKFYSYEKFRADSVMHVELDK